MGRAKLVTIIELARTCKVDEDTIRRWVRAGAPHEREERGQRRLFFDPAAVREWLAARGKTPGKIGRPSAIDGAPKDVRDQLALAELRKRLAQAERAELEVAERKGRLLDVAEVERGRLERIRVVKAGLLSLAARIAPRVVGREVREVERAVAEEVRRLLEEFSSSPAAGASET